LRAKHAHATTVHVELRRQNTSLRVDVRDDSVGGAAADGTTGIRGTADRVDVLGGVLAVHSPPSNGTHIAAEIPLAS
jgi:signal transduction histidine kinase